LALALRASGFTVQTHDGFLEVFGKAETQPLLEVLSSLANGTPIDIFAQSPNLLFEKFHPYLSAKLLQEDALSSRLDVAGLPRLARAILQ